jgi:hypothetical protein
MTAYQNCKVDAAVQTMNGGDGYGFNVRSNNRVVVSLMFATREDAEKARDEIRSAVERATQIVT